MKARYAVFTPGALLARIHAEGDVGTIAAWLLNRAEVGAFDYKVLDREENKVMDADYFMTKIVPKFDEHKCLSEDAIRRIIREEMSKLLGAVAKQAEVQEYMRTETMEDTFVAIVETVADAKALGRTNEHEDAFDHGSE